MLHEPQCPVPRAQQRGEGAVCQCVDTAKRADFERLQTAMFCKAIPCNPLPFLIGLTAHIEEHGTASIKTDEAKRVLWVINAIAYGELATIDMCAEWTRLDRVRSLQAEQAKQDAAEDARELDLHVAGFKV